MTQPTLHRTIGRPLDQPLSVFDLGRGMHDLRAEPAYEREGRNSIILHKEAAVRVVLMATRAGNVIQEHKVDGPITVQVLLGSIRFVTGDVSQRLGRGELLTLHGGVPHGVESIEDSAILLTIAGPSGS